MKNKILIRLYIVEIDQHYDIFVPTNEYIGKLIKLIVSSAFELSDIESKKEEYYLLNPDTGEVYSNSDILRNSNIKNAKKIYLI